MAEIGRWNGFKFQMTPSTIVGFTGLQIKGSCETKDKTSNKQQYVKRKNGKPSEVSLNVVLNAALGCDVRSQALKLVGNATDGKTDYFYVGNKKLLSCKLMLVEASVKETIVGDGNTWIHAEVQLNMKQCDKGGTSSSSSSGKKSSKKKSVKKTGKKTSKTTGKATGTSDGVDAVSGAAPSATKSAEKKTVNSAVNSINKHVSAAKKLTLTTK